MEFIVRSTIESAFNYSGQKCSACSIIYIPDNLLDDYICQFKIELKKYMENTENYGVINDISYNRLNNLLNNFKNDSEIEFVTSDIQFVTSDNNSNSYHINPNILLCNNHEHDVDHKSRSGDHVRSGGTAEVASRSGDIWISSEAMKARAAPGNGARLTHAMVYERFARSSAKSQSSVQPVGILGEVAFLLFRVCARAARLINKFLAGAAARALSRHPIGTRRADSLSGAYVGPSSIGAFVRTTFFESFADPSSQLGSILALEITEYKCATFCWT